MNAPTVRDRSFPPINRERAPPDQKFVSSLLSHLLAVLHLKNLKESYSLQHMVPDKQWVRDSGQGDTSHVHTTEGRSELEVLSIHHWSELILTSPDVNLGELQI